MKGPKGTIVPTEGQNWPRERNRPRTFSGEAEPATNRRNRPGTLRCRPQPRRSTAPRLARGSARGDRRQAEPATRGGTGHAPSDADRSPDAPPPRASPGAPPGAVAEEGRTGHARSAARQNRPRALRCRPQPRRSAAPRLARLRQRRSRARERSPVKPAIADEGAEGHARPDDSARREASRDRNGPPGEEEHRHHRDEDRSVERSDEHGHLHVPAAPCRPRDEEARRRRDPLVTERIHSRRRESRSALRRVARPCSPPVGDGAASRAGVSRRTRQERQRSA